MAKSQAYRQRVEISVQQGDILTYDTDVLVLKYAQALYGVDSAVAQRLVDRGVDLNRLLPKPGDFRFLPSHSTVVARHILFVGVEPLWAFGYREIREFARKTLEALRGSGLKTQHVCMTLHGPGYGLDEIEAFEAELAGLIDAITGRNFPEKLKKVTIVERNPDRAVRLSTVLPSLLPTGFVEIDLDTYLKEISEEASERFRSVGYTSESKPHIFVATPFTDNMDDVYHYGIQGAVKRAGFLCERADLSSFTGDILDWIKKRIRSASLVIADLSTANPNVYLEVGYAWGCGVPTVLLVRDTDDLRFDVQGQRCLVYSTIKELESTLTNELETLRLEMSG